MFSFTITSIQALAISKFLRSQSSDRVGVAVSDEGVWFVTRPGSWVRVTALESRVEGAAKHIFDTKKFLSILSKYVSTRIADMDAPVTIAVYASGVVSLDGSKGHTSRSDLTAPSWHGIDEHEYPVGRSCYSVSPVDRDTIWRIAQAVRTGVEYDSKLQHGFNDNGYMLTSDQYLLARGKVSLPEELANTPAFYLGIFKLLYTYRKALADADIAFTAKGWTVFQGMTFASSGTACAPHLSNLDQFRDRVANFEQSLSNAHPVGATMLPKRLADADFVDDALSLDELAPLEGHTGVSLWLGKSRLTDAFRIVDSREVFECKNHSSTPHAVMTSTGTLTGDETIRVAIMPLLRPRT